MRVRSDNRCFWCGAALPEGPETTYHAHLRIRTHTGACSEAIEGFERDYSCSARGRWRPVAHVLRLVKRWRPAGEGVR